MALSRQERESSVVRRRGWEREREQANERERKWDQTTRDSRASSDVPRKERSEYTTSEDRTVVHAGEIVRTI